MRQTELRIKQNQAKVSLTQNIMEPEADVCKGIYLSLLRRCPNNGVNPAMIYPYPGCLSKG